MSGHTCWGDVRQALLMLISKAAGEERIQAYSGPVFQH